MTTFWHFFRKLKEVYALLSKKAKKILSEITIEPLMLLDGLAFCNMSVFIEDMFMRKICEVSLNATKETCSNMTHHPNISSAVQLEFSVLAFYDGIIKSVIPLFFILFMGAWSDKYGRKIPLYLAELGHLFYALSLLIFSMVRTVPVRYLLIASFLESLGGGQVSFLMASNAYLSDITSEGSRTSRVSLANSLWFLGGPLGTLMGKFVYDLGGYFAVFGVSLSFTSLAILYMVFFVEESHGPNVVKKPPKSGGHSVECRLRGSIRKMYGIETDHSASPVIEHQKSDSRLRTAGHMFKDFFDPKRMIESFKCLVKRRGGNTRAIVFLVLASSAVRRLCRSPYVFAFSKHVLSWEAGDYSFWVTFKNLTAVLGSLVVLPLLIRRFHVADCQLGVIGSLSNLLEYSLYGLSLYAGPLFFWIAPVSALLINSCTIAQKAMLSKLVSSDELGKVSAVLGALDGVMPMVGYMLYMIVYKNTVTTFPAAHFFLGSSASLVMLLLFMIIRCLTSSRSYNIQETADLPPVGEAVTLKSVYVLDTAPRLGCDDLARKEPYLNICPVLQSANNCKKSVQLVPPNLSSTRSHMFKSSGLSALRLHLVCSGSNNGQANLI